jgi:hypothetical protein
MARIRARHLHISLYLILALTTLTYLHAFHMFEEAIYNVYVLRDVEPTSKLQNQHIEKSDNVCGDADESFPCFPFSFLSYISSLLHLDRSTL